MILVKIVCGECARQEAKAQGRAATGEDGIVDRVGIRNYMADRPWVLTAPIQHAHPVTVLVQIGRDDGKGPMGEILDKGSVWWPVE